MNRVSKLFYFGSYLAATVIGITFIGGPLLTADGELNGKHLQFVFIGDLFFLYALVIFADLIYEMWKAIPADVARTTPGKAVGFLFIPVFNLYWLFQALWGWTLDWNAYSACFEDVRLHVSERLALSISVLASITSTIGVIANLAGAMWFGILLGVPNIILVPIFIYRTCDVLNKVYQAGRKVNLEENRRGHYLMIVL